jgi:hypothetical protein
MSAALHSRLRKLEGQLALRQATAAATAEGQRQQVHQVALASLRDIA